jgi:hypothetical protein
MVFGLFMDVQLQRFLTLALDRSEQFRLRPGYSEPRKIAPPPNPFPKIVFDSRTQPIQKQNNLMSLWETSPDSNVDHPVAALTDITRLTEIQDN